jgi:hypothetical protein
MGFVVDELAAGLVLSQHCGIPQAITILILVHLPLERWQMGLLYRTLSEWFCLTTRRVKVQNMKLLIKLSKTGIHSLSAGKNNLFRCRKQSGGETDKGVGMHGA